MAVSAMPVVMLVLHKPAVIAGGVVLKVDPLVLTRRTHHAETGAMRPYRRLEHECPTNGKARGNAEAIANFPSGSCSVSRHQTPMM